MDGHKFSMAGTVAGLLLGLSVWIPATAAEYSVQIAALSESNSLFADTARQFGELYTVQAPSGITRYRIGRYSSQADAEQALAQLRDAGYGDAFIVEATVDAVPAGARVANRPDDVTNAADASVPIQTIPSTAVSSNNTAGYTYDQLPAHLQAKAVTLDGQLHIKEGDQFIPLDEYLQRN